MKVDEDGWVVLFADEEKEEEKVGKPFVTKPVVTPEPTPEPQDGWVDLNLTGDEGKAVEIDKEQESVGSKEDEAFWHPFARQVIGTGLTSAARVRPVDRILKRSTLRTVDDLYNSVNEVIPLGTKIDLEDQFLGDPKSTVEEVSSNMLSWIMSFAGPGGVVAGGVK